ncbi:hypothetical protein R1sor_025583 [Riccia sorocarpa]|uniref:Reverse transcriptase domain-containing protein n=1 Tax=Riccia sorocarpa TaxID=122646 RepID=A0ABD3GC21_9MARC
MKTNKAPGADGLTIEIVRTCWEWVGDECVKMVRAVWVNKRILRADCEGLIKLIHKGGERKDLGNWRPISLMTLIYKIISKLLANRVRIVIPKLIDKQQTGFVMGRRITDNVLSVKLGQEWEEWTSQNILFVKLDFIKAYDRVDHAFLWRTLECQGFDKEFIALVQGLAKEGSARVHVNAAFTQSIKVGRGVRQGCPLAPLLYAPCTQSFMALLRRATEEGKINGLFIQPREMLGHQLFAHDTGICVRTKEDEFDELKGNSAEKLINTWELGIGVHLQEGAGLRIIVKRMKERIFRWENAVLTWPARVVLIKHILSQIPTYLLLTPGCTKKVLKQWRSNEALLLLPSLRVSEAPTLDRILQVWFRMKKTNLRFSLEAGELPAHLPIQSLKQLCIISGRPVHNDFRMMEGLARVNRITSLTDIKGANGRVNPDQLAKLFPSMGHVRDSESEVCQWLIGTTIVDKSLTQTQGWSWGDDGKEYSGWKHTAKFWTTLQWGQTRSFKGLSDRWQEQRDPAAWLKRWKSLWDGPTLFKQKIWIWRILNQGIFTASRAEKWKVADGVCPRCRMEKETVEHLFWECQKVRDRSEWVAAAVMGQQVGKPSLLQITSAWELLEDTGRFVRRGLKEMQGDHVHKIQQHTNAFLEEARACLRLAMSRQTQLREILAEVADWDSSSEMGGLMPRARVVEEVTEDEGSSSSDESIGTVSTNSV